MAKCVVTGGAGFIGSHLVDELLARDNEVIIIDNFSTGTKDNIKHIFDKIELIEGNILDIDLLQATLKGVDFVFHLAALPSVQRSVENPLESLNNNIVGTHNLLIAARDNKVKKVIYSASSSAYGDSEKMPKEESMVTNPLSPYAITKLVGEYYCKVFSDVYGLDTVSLRYFNVFGPRQNPDSQYSAVIPKFIKLMNQGKRPIIFGDGLQSRDFTFVKNVVNANILAMQSGQLNGQVLNIACNKRIDLNSLVNMLNSILGTKLEPEYLGERIGDVKHSLADISKAKELIGYEPHVDFNSGLSVTVDWYG
ncbi:MAG: SDR family oxidoreductase [Nanoarchaeota archaeon]|nr:SDR family oxidoreductase [Nanoarchaeota archaeon]